MAGTRFRAARDRSTPGLRLRVALLSCLGGLAGCEGGPPDQLSVAPLDFEPLYDNLPVLGDVCSQRGRLFAVGRENGSGVFLEDDFAGLLPVDLDVTLPPLVACWQAPSGEVLGVGGPAVLERSLEGELSVTELGEDDVTIELADVSGATLEGAVAVGARDGSGVAFVRGDGSWSELALGERQVAPLTSVAVAEDGSLFIVGEAGAAFRIRGRTVERLASPSTRLTTIAAGAGRGGEEAAFAATFDGQVLVVEGDELVPFTEVQARFTAATATSEGELWLGGPNGALIRYAPLGSGELSRAPRVPTLPAAADIAAVESGRRVLVVAVTETGSAIWQLR